MQRGALHLDRLPHVRQLTLDGQLWVLLPLGPRACVETPLAVGEVQTYPIKRGREKGMMKIDEILSPVVHFQRSVIDEDGQLRSGHLWAETEAKGCGIQWDKK